MSDDIHIFVRALRQYDVISHEEVSMLEDLPLTIREYDRGGELVGEGQRPKHGCLLLNGYAAERSICQMATVKFLRCTSQVTSLICIPFS
jgi:hypothetical protein